MMDFCRFEILGLGWSVGEWVGVASEINVDTKPRCTWNLRWQNVVAVYYKERMCCWDGVCAMPADCRASGATHRARCGRELEGLTLTLRITQHRQHPALLNVQTSLFSPDFFHLGGLPCYLHQKITIIAYCWASLYSSLQASNYLSFIIIKDVISPVLLFLT